MKKINRSDQQWLRSISLTFGLAVAEHFELVVVELLAHGVEDGSHLVHLDRARLLLVEHPECLLKHCRWVMKVQMTASGEVVERGA